MTDGQPALAAKDWITAADAVHAIQMSLGCDHEGAAEILLSFTKSVAVEVIFTGYFVEYFDEGEDEYETGLSSTILPEEWRSFFLAESADCNLVWSKNQFVFKVLHQKQPGAGPLRITKYENVKLSRQNLRPLMLDEARRRGPKFGDFWEALAEELAVYIHENGPPDVSGISRVQTQSAA